MSVVHLVDFMKYTRKASLRVINEGTFKNGQVVYVHQYNRDWIKQIITEDMKKGNYRIGRFDGDTFNVCYVGRATDQTLQERMLQHRKYEEDVYFFFYSVAKTDEEAIKQECIDYHSFGGDADYLDNDYHPALLQGMNCPWKDCNHIGGE